MSAKYPTDGSQANGSEHTFYQAFDHYQKNDLSLNAKNIGHAGEQKERTISALGFIIYGLFMIINVSSALIMEDKEKKKNLYRRFFTTPLSLKSYNLQNILSYFCLANVTIAALLLLLKFGFHAVLGPSLFSVYLVLIFFSIGAIAIGVAVSSFAKNSRQANGISVLITTPVAMLGGLLAGLDHAFLYAEDSGFYADGMGHESTDQAGLR
ncbi:ABC transporter permease [Terrilactibacillus sp. S3-3]|nr:ABC transporter permease [Terrilactibacillus sp. S3-3]